MRAIAAVLLLVLGGSVPARTPDTGVTRFELRPGGEFRRLRGMNRSADPASIPADQFHLLTNVRLTPAGMVDRPGLMFPDHQADDAGCITGMIEIQELGVGLWVTPSAPSTTYSGQMLLGNFNEAKSGIIDYSPYASRKDQRADYRRYNDELLKDPPLSNLAAFPGADPTSPFARNTGGDFFPWTSLVKYKNRLLQLGTRDVLFPDDEDTANPHRFQCLWELRLPEGDDEIVVGYQLYADLWEITLGGTAEDEDSQTVKSIVTLFGRNDDLRDPTQESVQEIMYLGRGDGTVYSFDGTTVKQEVAIGANYVMRLGVSAGMGVLAVGSNAYASPPTTSVARYLDAPGGTWSVVTVPHLLNVSDIISFNGTVYLTSTMPTGGAWAGPRIYRLIGLAVTQIYEFTSTTPAGAILGLLFNRQGILHVIYRDSLSPSASWYAYRRVADGTWTAYPAALNFAQDFGAGIYWVHIDASSRVIVGGLWTEQNIGQGALTEKNMIVEISNWDLATGPDLSILYYNPIPGESLPGVGNQVIAVAPSDTVLNEEEL